MLNTFEKMSKLLKSVIASLAIIAVVAIMSLVAVPLNAHADGLGTNDVQSEGADSSAVQGAWDPDDPKPVDPADKPKGGDEPEYCRNLKGWVPEECEPYQNGLKDHQDPADKAQNSTQDEQNQQEQASAQANVQNATPVSADVSPLAEAVDYDAERCEKVGNDVF